MSLTEAHRIADTLKLAWQEFIDNFIDPRWPGKNTFVLKAVAGKCIFLDQEEGSSIGLCRIHVFKPASCAEWKATSFKKECRQGLSRYWNLSIGENEELQGSPDDLLCFQKYIDSLTQEEA